MAALLGYSGKQQTGHGVSGYRRGGGALPKPALSRGHDVVMWQHVGRQGPARKAMGAAARILFIPRA